MEATSGQEVVEIAGLGHLTRPRGLDARSNTSRWVSGRFERWTGQRGVRRQAFDAGDAPRLPNLELFRACL